MAIAITTDLAINGSAQAPRNLDGPTLARRTLCGQAHENGPAAVVQRYVDGTCSTHGIDEPAMLVVGRAVVVACQEQRRIDRDVEDARPLRLARADDDLRHRGCAQMFRPEARRAGNEALDLAGHSHRRYLLLVAAALSEHAQFEHGARAAV